MLYDYTVRTAPSDLRFSAVRHGNHAGFRLQVYLDHGDDRADFTCGGTGEILIDGIAWRVGYWGDRAELAMMAKLAAVLKK